MLEAFSRGRLSELYLRCPYNHVSHKFREHHTIISIIKCGHVDVLHLITEDTNSMDLPKRAIAFINCI
jgi:hypothetical protein